MTREEFAALTAVIEQAVERAFAVAEKGQGPTTRPTPHLRVLPGGQAPRKPKRPAPEGAG